MSSAPALPMASGFVNHAAVPSAAQTANTKAFGNGVPAISPPSAALESESAKAIVESLVAVAVTA